MAHRLRWIRRHRLALVVLAALILTPPAVSLLESSTLLVPNMRSYRVVDERTIVVSAYGVDWVRVTGMTETADAVRISIATTTWWVPAPRLGSITRHDLVVSLARDLGTRTVEDAAGNPVPQSR
jgi:hypothetical protein